MIQRIQSLYLLLASGALGSQFALPYLSTDSSQMTATVPALSDGQLNPLDNIGLLGLTGLGLILGLVAIFLFKNRNLQGKMTALGMMVGILLLALAAFVTFGIMKTANSDPSLHWGAGWAGPVVGLLGFWLAGHAIRKDEKLVRSMARLR